MFPTFDPKMFEAFSADPASFLGKIAEFQRANFEAAREITENNAKAFQQLAAIHDPQQFVTAQPAILQAVVQRNMEIVTQLWQSLGTEMAPKGKGRK
ncbi:MAG: phasin family protein [Magnetospirillum sp.]|nr:phasin family protein [Magnetospirillum sp.]